MTDEDLKQEEDRRGQYLHGPLVLMIVAFTFFVIGIWALVWGFERTPASRSFVLTPGFQVWAVLIGTQTAYWAVMLVPVWRELQEFKEEFGDHKIEVGVSGVGLILLLLIAPWIAIRVTGPPVLWPLWGLEVKVVSLTVIGGLLLGVPALCGILLAQFHVEREKTLPALVDAQAALHRFLTIAGTLIGLATLAFGAARSAAVPTYVPEERLPREEILVYGAFLTVLLLFVYIPAYVAIRAASNKALNEIFPLEGMPEASTTKLTNWFAQRKALAEMLKVDVSPRQQLEASLFILSPLLSAVISLLIPKS